MREVPKTERQEVVDVLVEWGYKGKKLKDMTDMICSNDKAWLEFMMAFELKLAPVDKSAPFKSFLTVLTATIFGSVTPLLPFIFFSGNITTSMVASVLLSAFVLFMVGYYEAKTTLGSVWRSGFEMLIIGLTAGLAGYLIGRIFGAVPT
jgi:VIT1/CCC1 family predicted Fe2+/Mn2+ transporter